MNQGISRSGLHTIYQGVVWKHHFADTKQIWGWWAVPGSMTTWHVCCLGFHGRGEEEHKFKHPYLYEEPSRCSSFQLWLNLSTHELKKGKSGTQGSGVIPVPPLTHSDIMHNNENVSNLSFADYFRCPTPLLKPFLHFPNSHPACKLQLIMTEAICQFVRGNYSFEWNGVWWAKRKRGKNARN